MSELLQGIAKGDRRAIAKAITLVESLLPNHQAQSLDLLAKLEAPKTPCLRLGISGVPGVGKSTFIEALGNYLIDKAGKKVGVLAIDPSSPIRGGSILGDKTRMESLATRTEAFIRPSPTQGFLGGVAKHSREAGLILEAAGFDVVIYETVGVGQSEVMVSSMVDVFLLLQMPSTGDELQGIKKGILELADVIAINKADGDLTKAAQKSRLELQSSVGSAPKQPSIVLCSALENRGVAEAWEVVVSFFEQQKSSGIFDQKRKIQNDTWLKEEVKEAMYRYLMHDDRWKKFLADSQFDKTPSVAADKFARSFFDR